MADGQPIEVRVEPHYSAAELAGVPGMPQTLSAVIRLAKRESWPHRKRQGRGGGREYPESCLPKETRTELSRRAGISAAARIAHRPEVARLQISESIERAARWREVQRGMARYAGFTGIKKDRADARSDMVGALRTYAQARGVGLYTAAEHFAADYNAGAIEATDVARRLLGDSISAVSLRRWDKAMREHSSAALAGDYGNRAGDSLIDRTPALYELVVGLLAAQPHLSAKLIHRAVHARFAATDTPVPKLRTLQRWLDAWKQDNAEVFTAVRNPDEWKNKYKVAFGSASEAIERLNQRWEMDSTPADVMLVDGRHTIMQIVDVWPRRRMFHVSKSSSAEALCQIFRKGLLAWGVPEEVKIDNGQDYVSHRFTRVCADLGIEVKTSAPFSPWEKPHVESGFRTFSHDLLEMLPGFIGHNVAEASAIRARESFADRLFKKNANVEIKMTAAELQAFCDKWTAGVYETEPRSGLNGMTVKEKVASWRGDVRMVEDERTLDTLLAEAPDGHGLRTVGKKGLRIDNLLYVAAELVEFIGQAVHVRYTEDVGRVVVYHDGQFVCVAECPEATGVSRQELAIEARHRQTEATQARRREIKALSRKAKVGEVLAEILDQKAAEASSVVALPVKPLAHATQGTDAARDAATALDAPADALPPLTRRDFEDVAELQRKDQQAEPTAEEKFKRALTVELQPEAERNDLDRQFLKNYQDTSEYRGRRMVFDDFGPSAFGLGDEYRALMPDQRGIDRLFDNQQ